MKWWERVVVAFLVVVVVAFWLVGIYVASLHAAAEAVRYPDRYAEE